MTAGQDAEVPQEATRWSEVIPAYRRHYELANGERQDRLRAADSLWAWETVTDAALNGSLPMPVLDALVTDPGGDGDYRGYIGAGPLEDLLKSHADTYAQAFAERAGTSALWGEALSEVWLNPAEWRALPEQLRKWVPEPRPADAADSTKAHRSSRRPSKRQDSKGRQRGR